MTAHLRDNDIETIVQILDGWTGKLTWEGLVEKVDRRLHRKYTRLALIKKPRILEAFRLTKSRLAQGKNEVKELSLEDQLISNLRALAERLTLENHRLLEQHLVWRYNAHLKGLDLDFLNRPIPLCSRNPTVL